MSTTPAQEVITAELEPPVSDATALVQVIERMALNPDVDVDKLERMLAMQERIFERNAEQAFNAAMRGAQREMPKVLKDAENASTHSRYATLEALSNAMSPVIAKHGFSTSFGTADSPLQLHYRVTCRVSHVDGHSRDYHADVPADTMGAKGTPNKTLTHGFGSTMSYGRRYLKMLIFDVATTDDDGQAAENEPISAAQKEALIELLKGPGQDGKKFLAWLKVASLDEIPATRFNEAVRALEAKAKAGGTPA